eukprot:g4120.t1
MASSSNDDSTMDKIIHLACIGGIAGAFIYSRFYQTATTKTEVDSDSKKTEEEVNIKRSNTEKPDEKENKSKENLPEQTDDLEISQFRYAWSIQTYLRFANLPFEERNVTYPTTTAAGPFPLLRHGNRLFRGEENILLHLSEIDDIDSHLTMEEKAECEAFKSLINEKIKPLIQHRRYLDNDTFAMKTLPELRRVLPWPLSWYLPNSLKDDVGGELDKLGISNLSKDQVNQKMSIFLSYINVRLQKKRNIENEVENEKAFFFFGKKPTSLDAVVFGQLAIMLNEPGLGFSSLLKEGVMEENAGKMEAYGPFPALAQFYTFIRDFTYHVSSIECNDSTLKRGQRGGPFGLAPPQNRLLLAQTLAPDFVPFVHSTAHFDSLQCRQRSWGRGQTWQGWGALEHHGNDENIDISEVRRSQRTTQWLSSLFEPLSPIVSFPYKIFKFYFGEIGQGSYPGYTRLDRGGFGFGMGGAHRVRMVQESSNSNVNSDRERSGSFFFSSTQSSSSSSSSPQKNNTLLSSSDDEDDYKYGSNLNSNPGSPRSPRNSPKSGTSRRRNRGRNRRARKWRKGKEKSQKAAEEEEGFGNDNGMDGTSKIWLGSAIGVTVLFQIVSMNSFTDWVVLLLALFPSRMVNFAKSLNDLSFEFEEGVEGEGGGGGGELGSSGNSRGEGGGGSGGLDQIVASNSEIQNLIGLS